jgi:hypothetical protein
MSPVPGGYGRIARPQCGSHEGLILHQRSGEAPCVWCSGQGRAEVGPIPPRDPPPPPARATVPVSATPPAPLPPAWRYFVTAGGIIVGTGQPTPVLLAALDAGDVTELSEQDAHALMAARGQGVA